MELCPSIVGGSMGTFSELIQTPEGQREIEAGIAKMLGWKNIHALEGGNVYRGEPHDDFNHDAYEHARIHTRAEFLPHVEWIPFYLTEYHAAAQVLAWLDQRYRWEIYGGIDPMHGYPDSPFTGFRLRNYSHEIWRRTICRVIFPFLHLVISWHHGKIRPETSIHLPIS